jgi:hypothetical protein
MVERMKDEEDRKLEALFRLPPVDDGGFSERVMKRVRRRVWVRRWTLPIAAAVGAAIAAKPAMDLLQFLPLIADFLPQEVKTLPPDLFEQLPGVFSGLLLLGATMLGLRMAGD